MPGSPPLFLLPLGLWSIHVSPPFAGLLLALTQQWYLLPTIIWAPAVLLPAPPITSAPAGILCSPGNPLLPLPGAPDFSGFRNVSRCPPGRLDLVVSVRHPLLLSFSTCTSSLLQSVCHPAHCVRLFSSFLFYSDIPSNVYFKPYCSPLLPFWRPCCITVATVLFGQNFPSLSHSLFFLIHF